MLDLSRNYDVLVVGGGNAGLCAAMTATRGGARVRLLETAPQVFRGGNSRHTRDIRYMHDRPDAFVTGRYPEEEFWDDLLRVTRGETNEALARLTIRSSADLGDWMPLHGVRWQRPLRGTLHLARTNLFFLGGGKAMVNAYYDTAGKLGVQIAYGAEVRELNLEGGAFRSAVVEHRGVTHEVRAKSLVVASGGFEANIPLAEAVLGRCRRQLRDSRDAVQPGAHAGGTPRAWGQAGRQPTGVPRGGGGCPRPEIRRRDRHPPG